MSEPQPMTSEMARIMKQAGVVYRFDKTLMVIGNMVVAVDKNGAHYCMECDGLLDKPCHSMEEFNEMNRRDFGKVPTHTIAICDPCYEKILNWYRSRQ